MQAPQTLFSVNTAAAGRPVAVRLQADHTYKRSEL